MKENGRQRSAQKLFSAKITTALFAEGTPFFVIPPAGQFYGRFLRLNPVFM